MKTIWRSFSRRREIKKKTITFHFLWLFLRMALAGTRAAKSPVSLPLKLPQILTRIIHKATVDPGISAALRSVGFIDVLSSVPAESSRRTRKKRRMRLADATVCAASLQTFRNNPGVMDYIHNAKGVSELSRNCLANICNRSVPCRQQKENIEQKTANAESIWQKESNSTG
jgi:hypothetical protein